MRMKITVIGGTRFIGAYVVRQLHSYGHQVQIFHRGQHELGLPAGVGHVHSPMAAMPVTQFSEELRRWSPDVVIHMIAMGEADARAAVEFFEGAARRIVVVSSGDVYLAYGRFTGLEPGPVVPCPLTEESPLRTVLYPYRKQANLETDLVWSYEKILVERAVRESSMESVILRLPKVYGREENADLKTVYAFRDHPQWRWTHGYVENVAAAIALAALHPAAAGGIYNVGEEVTPTIAERLAGLPESNVATPSDAAMNFEQDIAYDTSRIRRELGFREIVSYEEGLRRTLRG